MLAELLAVVLTMPAPNAAVTVQTDGIPAHWRKWSVVSGDPMNRHDRCRARMDARRVMLDRPVTLGVPYRCMTKRERGKFRPDPAPH